MASNNKLYTTIFVLSLLLSSTLTSACGSCKPSPPKPVSPPPAKGSCPTLNLGVCADVLGLVNVVIGDPPSGSKCCALIQGLVDLEAALCLCTAIKANVLGINLDVPVTLGLLLSACGKTLPPNFQCPS